MRRTLIRVRRDPLVGLATTWPLMSLVVALALSASLATAAEHAPRVLSPHNADAYSMRTFAEFPRWRDLKDDAKVYEVYTYLADRRTGIFPMGAGAWEGRDPVYDFGFVRDPVKMINVYSVGYCDMLGPTMAGVMQDMGIGPARTAQPARLGTRRRRGVLRREMALSRASGAGKTRHRQWPLCPWLHGGGLTLRHQPRPRRRSRGHRGAGDRRRRGDPLAAPGCEVLVNAGAGISELNRRRPWVRLLALPLGPVRSHLPC